jgi:hypothetical protein
MALGAGYGNAYAQAQLVSIQTSADDLDGKFSGEAVLQVVLTDPNADDDNTVEDIQVNISLKPKSGPVVPEQFLVPETTNSSGRFELFLVHVDATNVGADDLDANNRAGVEGDGTCVSDCAPYITFGPGGDISVDSDLYDEARFDISSDDTAITIKYEEDNGTLQIDRQSYGSNSFLYIFISDGDANLDPTRGDQITVDSDASPNSDLLLLNGASFDNQPVVFRETGDNTGVFKGRYQLGSSITVNSESIILRFHDKANYDADLGSPENGSNNIDEISFTIGDDSGNMSIDDNNQIPSPPIDESPIDGNMTATAKIGQETTSVIKPSLKEINGNAVQELRTGKQVILSTTVTNNNNNQSQPFTAILEVRDANGVTIYLQWQKGILGPSDISGIGLSWTPERAGNYEIRTFVVSDMLNAEVLSPVATSGIITVY